jgi:hypothetical protein
MAATTSTFGRYQMERVDGSSQKCGPRPESLSVAAGNVGWRKEADMWLWIGVGVLAYACLMTLVFGILRAASTSDRMDRIAFQAWLESKGGSQSRRPDGSNRSQAA